MRAGILSNRRRIAPFGLAGGGEGALGKTSIERASGMIEVLGSTADVAVEAGDAIVIETPGGGGYGTP
jgi:5-oxoprolinase (ATP-hydrolysing)